MDIAKQVEKLRFKLAFTQHDLGRHLGVSDMTVSRWERGDAVPCDVLIKLALIAHDTGLSPWPFLNAAGLTREELKASLADTP